MAEVEKVILFPRFSAFAGGSEWRTQPVNVRKFSAAELIVWRSTAIGSLSLFTFLLEESADLVRWTAVAGSQLNPGAGDEATADVALDFPWIRAAVLVAGSGAPDAPALTCWAVANFVARE